MSKIGFFTNSGITATLLICVVSKIIKFIYEPIFFLKNTLSTASFYLLLLCFVSLILFFFFLFVLKLLFKYILKIVNEFFIFLSNLIDILLRLKLSIFENDLLDRSTLINSLVNQILIQIEPTLHSRISAEITVPYELYAWRSSRRNCD